MEDALHGKLQGVIVGIDRFGIVGAALWMKGLGGGGERFDRLVAENDERSHRSETAGERFVATRAADAVNDVFATELFQIIGGVSGTVLWVPAIAKGAHPSGDIGGSEAVG